MLCYKGWLETRFRMLFLVVISLFILFLSLNSANSARAAEQGIRFMFALLWAMAAIVLGGAGIKTQPTFQPTKGLHGSRYFTLSLPVSRFRLLVVRAALGLVETAGVIAGLFCAAWILFPALRTHYTPSDALAYVWASSLCVSAIYFLSVLLATFLDDLWQVWGSLLVVLFLRWLRTAVPMPPALDIFDAMGASSSLFTHALPWATMGVSLGAAAVMFCVATWVVQTREY